MNKFVKNTHLLARLRAAMKKKLRVPTSSKHKETTLSGKRLHELTIVSMVQRLERYLNPFDEQPARNIKTGNIIGEKIINGLLNSSILGENLLLEFINKRLLPSEERINFFSPIKSPKLETRLKKKKQKPKVINVLKEDKQAFGLLVGKTTSPYEDHSYPLTSIPLALTSPDGDLRQGSKAALRNYSISESNALSSVPVQKTKWIVDGMSVIRSMQSRLTWEEFCQAFIEARISDKGFLPVALDIIMDTYRAGRMKEMTQNRRGTTTRKVVIGGADQAMLKSRDSATFLSDGDSKAELIQFIAGYCKARNFRRKLKIPVKIT